jgi:hypothetical protein
MSLDTWKQEFYPVAAVECPGNVVDAIAHSIRKWTGLTKENLERHGLRKVSADGIGEGDEPSVSDGTKFYTCSFSCALCVHFSCAACPLAQARGGDGDGRGHVPCDSPRSDESLILTPWRSWTDKADPQPMLTWLRKAADANTPI